jgi:hypothetical protein
VSLCLINDVIFKLKSNGKKLMQKNVAIATGLSIRTVIHY